MNTDRSTVNKRLIYTLAVLTLLLLCSNAVFAASKKEIDIKTDAVLTAFKNESGGAEAFLKAAKGVLVFPDIVKAGIGIGGQYGEGVLRVNNKPAGYFSITGLSLGVQLGAQLRSVILVFMDQQALDKFKQGNGWDVGVDGSIALINIGAGKDINTTNVKDPVVGFLIANKGLMFNVTLEGSKIRQLDFSNQTKAG